MLPFIDITGYSKRPADYVMVNRTKRDRRVKEALTRYEITYQKWIGTKEVNVMELINNVEDGFDLDPVFQLQNTVKFSTKAVCQDLLGIG